jgi:Conjugative transposon protein TcpC
MRVRLRATHEPVGTGAVGAPSSRAEVQHTSVRRMRLLARAPRFLAVAVAVVLALAGLRTVVFGAPAPKIQRVYEPASNDVGAEGFVEAFARAYLSWNGSGDTQAYSQSLALYNPQFADGQGVQPSNAPERVSWSRVVQDQSSALKGSRIVTVELQLSPGARTCYLAVPVNRAQNGALAITTWPSFVGAPAVQPAPPSPSLAAVTDPTLVTVVTRAITNYLAGDQNDLQADLAPGAQVTYPAQQLQVSGPPVSLQSTGPGGVLVTVRATDAQGASYTLAYEVGVELTERWYVDSIEVIPSQ